MDLFLIIMLCICGISVLILYRQNKKLKEQCFKKDQVLMDCFNSMIKHGIMIYENGMYINIATTTKEENNEK